MYGEFPSGPEFSERECKEKFKAVFEDLERFDKFLYPRIKSFLSLRDSQEMSQLGLNDTADDLVEELSGIDALTSDFYYNYLAGKNSPIKKFVSHDLSGVATTLINYLPSPGDDFRMPSLATLQQVARSYPAYSLILKDVLLKYLQTQDDFELKPKAVDFGMFEQGLNYFFNSQAVTGRVKDFFAKQLADLPGEYPAKVEDFLSHMFGLLAADEEVVAEPGVVFNTLNNIIRNACKEGVGSTAVNFDFRREGDELVFVVADDGRGMNAKQLRSQLLEGDEDSQSSTEIDSEKNDADDPNSIVFETKYNNPNYIFSEGKESSGTSSTGLGLAHAPERLKKFANAKLRVWSRNKDNISGAYNVFPPDNLDPTPVQYLKLSGKLVSTSTVFEIRLPITKKNIKVT